VYTASDPYTNYFFGVPNTFTNSTNFNSGTFLNESTAFAQGGTNMKLEFDMREETRITSPVYVPGPYAGYGYPYKGFITSEVDFKRGFVQTAVDLLGDGHNDYNTGSGNQLAFNGSFWTGNQGHGYSDPKIYGSYQEWAGALATSATSPPLGSAALYDGTASGNQAYEGRTFANKDERTSTQWKLDDVFIKAKGYTQGDMISPRMDFTNMESGYLEFMDRVETGGANPLGFEDWTHKEIYYSFDYDDTNPSLATWQLMPAINKTGTSVQDWQKNNVEIPCAGGKDNVRVKFSFDTRKNTNLLTNANGTNITEFTDFDGWNIDNIKLVGRKSEPTDFYYYRQDLNSEFVAGAGAKLSSVGLPADISGFSNTIAATNTSLDPLGNPQTAFVNNAPAVGATPNPITFNIVSPIDTTVTPVLEDMNINTSVDVLGYVTRTLGPVPPTGAAGEYGRVFDSGHTLLGAETTADQFVTLTNNNGVFIGGESIIIGGDLYTIINVVGDTLELDRNLDNNYGIGSYVKSPLSAGGVPALAFNNPMELDWDLTGTTNTGVTTNGSLAFTSEFVGDSSTGLTVSDDPWAFIYDENDVVINPAPGGISMANGAPINTTYVVGNSFGATMPSSVKIIDGIDLSAASSGTLTFDYVGLDVTQNGTIRTLEILNDANAVVSTTTYPEDIASTSVNIDLDALGLAGQSNVKLRFTTSSSTGFRTTGSGAQNIPVWDVSNIQVVKTDTPLQEAGKYITSFETGPYNIAFPSSTLGFQYSALNDPLGLYEVTKRKIYASVNGGAYVEIFNAINPTATGVAPNYLPGLIDLGIAPAGSTVRLKFESEIDVPLGIVVPTKNDIFDIQNLEIRHNISDGYNIPEAIIDINRPNLSFDPRGKNVEGRYTDVNNRVQISNSDYPMFSNTLLTYVETNSNKLKEVKHDTYVEWSGLNTAPPARVLNRFSGLVEPQTDGNFLLSSDGLDNYYDTTDAGSITNMYVDEAVAINTGKIVGKLPTSTSVSQEKTGWGNAASSGGGIWLPHVGATKFEETASSTYQNMTVWAKKTFLIDAVNPPPANGVNTTISANDDAYLYVNGYNVRSTVFSQAGVGGPLELIDRSDYAVNDYVMIDGQIGKITALPGGGGGNRIQVVPEPVLAVPYGTFDDLTAIPIKKPYTVYHVNQATDSTNTDITVAANAVAGAYELTLTSIENLYPGQLIYVNNQPIIISQVEPLDGFGVPRPNIITFTTPLAQPANAGALIVLSYSDSGPAANVTAPTGLLTSVNSASSTFDIAPLLRKGFNTIGVKASEDKGNTENFTLSVTGITAIGDTFSATGGASGINTDSTWAIKTSPSGYDGVNTYFDGVSYINEPSDPLEPVEIVDLFKTEKVDKMQTIVHFDNQNSNGEGRVSLIKGVSVTITGEPTIQTIKTTTFTTDSNIDGTVITQLTKGYVNGLEQTGIGLGLNFDPKSMTGNDLNYSTDINGQADINVFFDKKDNIVNDATMNVTVTYVEDEDGDGLISATEQQHLKTRIMGMQDTRSNSGVNPLSTAAATSVAGLRERFQYVETTSNVAIGAVGATSISVNNLKNFSVGTYVRIEDGSGGHQAVKITAVSAVTGPGTITFAPPLQLPAVPNNSRVTTYELLTDIDQAEADKLYSSNSYIAPFAGAVTAGYTSNTVTVNEQYLVTTKGRSGGADAGAGNENKLAKRLKQVLDSSEFQEMIKFGLLDGIYLAATSSDNRGDQITGKLILDWDPNRKRLSVKQGAFSAVYKS
ncbi:MAG: hypothetical protein AABZ74_03925, partial [Cyanobacteriota bacterium]